MASSPINLRVRARLCREISVSPCLTLAGAILRLWRPGRLGLVHFDEGIYAIAGLWSVSPRGLASLDPTVIAYAPPGFPFLVGLAYLGLGVSDVAAILVSIVAGTLTIPAAAWLARRTFGAGAGAAAAAFVASSGLHVAFSRMALTDASFLLFWVLAIGLRPAIPGTARALAEPIALGLAVGLAQLFKYNGWLLGVIVVLAACIGVLVDAERAAANEAAAIWGLACSPRLVAGVVYWPWFRFVEVARGLCRAAAAPRRATWEASARGRGICDSSSSR